MRNLWLWIALLIIASCTGGVTAQRGDQPVAPLAPRFSLPWPPAVPHKTSATLNFTVAELAECNSGSTVAGPMLQVRTGTDAFGWARFAIGGRSAASAPVRVSLTTAALRNACWLGVGNYYKQRWDWIARLDSTNLNAVIVAGKNCISPSGALHFVIAVEPGQEADITAGSIEVMDQSGGPPFPRLGMWYPSWDRNTVAEMARYDVLIGDFTPHMYWDDKQPLFSAALRAANPDVMLLTYTAFSEVDYGPDGDGLFNPHLHEWPDEWFLTEAGTALAEGLDAVQTTLRVADWQHTGPAEPGNPTTWDIFHVDGDVLCDGEIMTVTAIDQGAQTLTVERDKYGRGGGMHASGARIAPLIRFWPGTFMMNLTSQCPRVQLPGAPAPENWNEYSFRFGQLGDSWLENFSGDQDGFLFDRMEDEESSVIFWDTAASVDLNRDNVPDSFASFDTAWLGGIVEITQMFKNAYPGQPILRNLGGGRRFSDYNGDHSEAWPNEVSGDWATQPAEEWHYGMFGDVAENFGGIAEWAALAPSPNLTWVETYFDDTGADKDGDGTYDNPFDVPGFKPGFQKMRWGMASALLAGTFFSYEINTNGHGSLGLMWFDEYDDSGRQRGYLGYPLGEITASYTEPGLYGDVSVWGREYTGGYIAVNPLKHAQEISLPAGRWRRLVGTQVPAVNNGELFVSTLANPAKVIVPAKDGLILKRVQT
jgi:hypothetical protein